MINWGVLFRYTDKIELLEARRNMLTTRAHLTSANPTEASWDEGGTGLPRNRRHHDFARPEQPTGDLTDPFSSVIEQLAALQRDHYNYRQRIQQ